MPVSLETERLLLRPFTEADADALFALHNDPEVMHFLNGGKPTPRAVIVRETLPRFLQADPMSPGFGAWAAIEKATGTFLGWFSLRSVADRASGTVELGYRLHKAAWGKGYGTEGSRALIHRGFSALGVQRVTANTMTVNTASRRVMEKAGLTLVRTYHDVWPDAIAGSEHGDVEYALTKADWERQEAAARAQRTDNVGSEA